MHAPIVQTRELTRRYGDDVALDRVSLSVPRQVVYGLIGPNGAGKSTMLSLVAGLRRPTSGDVTVAVQPGRVAVLSDTPAFEPWLTGREVVDLARRLVDAAVPESRVEASLEQAGIADASHRRVGGYSRGMLQRLGLASCIVAEPELLLLDEPSSALDPAGRRDVLELVSRLSERATVVFSSHVLTDVERICDVVGVLHEGRLRYEGPPAGLRTRDVTRWRVQLAARDAASPEAAARVARALAQEHWVDEAVVARAGVVQVRAGDQAAAERGLVAVLARCGVAVSSVESSDEGFEQAFLELTS